jgi:hypothetical protein
VLLLPIAFATAAIGFSLYAAAGLPYPDPTAEMLLRQDAEIRRAQALLIAGILIFVVDTVWLWKTRRKSR